MIEPPESSCAESTSADVQEEAEKAFEKILRCVNVREQSSARMREKLQRAGFSVYAIDISLERAQQCFAIDDVRYSECLIRFTLSQGKDLRFVLKEIESLNVNPLDLEAYQEYLELDEEDLINRALSILQKSRFTSKNIYASAQRKLISKGYSFSVASHATRRYMQQLDSRCDY